MKIETATLETMHEMCVESLSPDIFEKWESVRDALLNTRQAFKKKDISEITDEDAQCIGYDSAESFHSANKDYADGVGLLSVASFKYLNEAGYRLPEPQ